MILPSIYLLHHLLHLILHIAERIDGLSKIVSPATLQNKQHLKTLTCTSFLSPSPSPPLLLVKAILYAAWSSAYLTNEGTSAVKTPSSNSETVVFEEARVVANSWRSPGEIVI